MNSNRRDFISTAFKAAALLPLSHYLNFFSGFENIPGILPSLIDLHQLFKTPVILKSVEMIRTQGELFLRVTSEDGAVGITQCNERMEYLLPILKGLVVPIFLKKDARDIEQLVKDVYNDGRNYKYAGMPFSNCVGHLELSLWDMLGKMINKPAAHFFGKPVRTEVPVYLSSLTRENTAEEEVAWLGEQLEKTGAKAVKLKVGGRMTSKETVAGRSNKIISLARKTFGDGLTIYADANGSFNVEEGIKMGLMLEDYGVKIFEEPCVFEDFTSNKKVADALLKVIVAGGEQDTSLHRFQYILDNNVYDVVQPDLYYNGGLLRCIAIANMAARKGKSIAPHSPKADPLEASMLQFAAVVPNLYGFQEYPARPEAQPSWYAPHFKITNGTLSIPAGAGLGVMYDDNIWRKAERV